MNASRLTARFEALGARLKLNELDTSTHWLVRPMETTLTLDVREDPMGQYFNLSGDPSQIRDLRVTDYRPSLQYLLLTLDKYVPKDQRQLFKCGHDNFGWYVRDESDQLREKGLTATIDFLKFEKANASSSLLHLT